MGKKRLDVLLVEKGLASSREKAKAIIMSGIVYVDNQKEDKPGASFAEDKKIEIRGKTLKYVSRGGLKLEKAIKEFNISLRDRVCIDIGASTGGFTDCMLQNNASKVFAIDVGRGQLDWGLRNNPKVVSMEKTNIRFVELEQIGELVDFISIDVSFISLSLVLPVARKLIKEGGEIVALIKPQFEAGREEVGKKGVVRDRDVHNRVIGKVFDISIECGFSICGLTFSPIKGPEGNIEYLIFLKNDKKVIEADELRNKIDNVTALAFDSLKARKK